MSARSTASPFLRTGLAGAGLGVRTSLQWHRPGPLSLELVLECRTEDPVEFRWSFEQFLTSTEHLEEEELVEEVEERL